MMITDNLIFFFNFTALNGEVGIFGFFHIHQ